MSPTAPPGPARRTATAARFHGSWRSSLRIARREIRRAKGRSALVTVMIGVPVMLIAALIVFTNTVSGGPAQDALRQLGAADAVVTPQSREPIIQDPYGWVTNGGGAGESWSAAEVADAVDGELTPLRSGASLLHTDDGAVSASVRELDLRKPVSEGLGTVTAGRLPHSHDEILVSEALVDRGFTVGSTVPVGREEPRDMTVTGVVRNPAQLDGRQLVALPGAVLDTATTTRYLVQGLEGEIDWAQVRDLNARGLAVISRSVVTDPPPAQQIPEQARLSSGGGDGDFYALVAAIIVLEIILLAGPAFAVSARRQARHLALLVAVGASARDVRRVVLAQALLLGLGSALLGVGLGIVGAAAARPLLEPFVGAEITGLAVPALPLVGLVATGTLAALGAAFVPARLAARRDTVAALSGRPAEAAARRGWPVVGVLLVAAGLVVTGGSWITVSESTVVVGAVAAVLGAILLIPLVLRLVGRLGRRLPLALRLATRDAARHRRRTTPAVAAIMGTVAGVTAIAIGSASDFAEARRDYTPRAPMGTMVIAVPIESAAENATMITERVRTALPGHTPHVLRTSPFTIDNPTARTAAALDPTCGSQDPVTCAVEVPTDEQSEYGPRFPGPLIADPAVLAAQLGTPLSPEERRTLQAGGVVLVPHESALDPQGRAQVVSYTEPEPGTSRQRELTRLPGTVLGTSPDDGRSAYLADLVMTPKTANALNVDTQPWQIIVPPGETPIESEQRERVAEFVQALAPDRGNLVYVETGFDWSYLPIALGLAAVGGLIVLVGTATATALALTDARPDLATLAAVGASARLRRRIAMAQAGIIGGLGALLGVVVGLGHGIAVTYPLTEDGLNGHILDIPWGLLGVVILAVPVVAVAGAGLLTRPRLPLPERVE